MPTPSLSNTVIKARITTTHPPKIGCVVQGQTNGRPIRTSPVTVVQTTEGGWLVCTQNSTYFVQVA